MSKQKRLTTSLLSIAMLSLPLYSQAKTFVYVSAPDIDNVYQYSLDENIGSLEIQDAYYLGGDIQYSMISPDKKYFYAVSKEKSPGFISLKINKDNGSLENRQDNKLEYPYKFITTNPSGDLLLGIHKQNNESATYTENFIRIQKIKDAKPGEVIATYSGLYSYDYPSFDNKGVNIYSDYISNNLKYIKEMEDFSYIPVYKNNKNNESSPDNQLILVKDNHNINDHIVKKYVYSSNNFLYTYNPFDTSIIQYSFSDNGIPNLIFKTKSIGMKISIFQENSFQVFMVENKPTTRVLSYNYAELKSQFNINDIKITPNNKFLYTSDSKNNQIIGYKIDEKTGNPKIIGTWEAEKDSSSVSIDPNNKWLISTGKASNYISVFSINQQDGTLHLSERKKLYDDSEKITEKTISIINL